VIYIPQSNLRVGRGREEKVTTIWDESDLRDGFGVVLVCVDKLLRYEVLGFVVTGELDI
jgi:hypothetical protein